MNCRYSNLAEKKKAYCRSKEKGHWRKYHDHLQIVFYKLINKSSIDMVLVGDSLGNEDGRQRHPEGDC